MIGRAPGETVKGGGGKGGNANFKEGDAPLAKFESAGLPLNIVDRRQRRRVDVRNNQVVQAKTLGTSGCGTPCKKSRLRPRAITTHVTMFSGAAGCDSSPAE
eukprot:scaffold6402_cov110-Isochrysis_galbana.AAC.1